MGVVGGTDNDSNADNDNQKDRDNDVDTDYDNDTDDDNDNRRRHNHHRRTTWLSKLGITVVLLGGQGRGGGVEGKGAGFEVAT